MRDAAWSEAGVTVPNPVRCQDRVHRLCRGSAERERKRRHARIEKRDLALSISNGLRVSDQLIQPP